MFNEVKPKRTLQEAFDRLTEYEKGYIANLRNSFIIDQKLDPSKREYSQKIIISYSSKYVNVNKVLDYLASYFDIFGYKVNYYKILAETSDSKDFLDITIHKTVRSKDISFIDSSPLDIIKLEEERNKENYDRTITTAEEDELIYDSRLMTAEEAREKYNRLLANNKSDIEFHISKINNAIEYAITKGSKVATYTFMHAYVDVVDKIVEQLRKCGYTVAYNPGTLNNFYEVLTIGIKF